ncbi:hypothetical protein DNTS_006337, partial [Danionella cerebrum]
QVMEVDKYSGYDSQGEESSSSGPYTRGSSNNPFIESVRPLIELIDSLKCIGLDEDINLPSIAVVGDQSSGKSSVLEALSGVALPRGSAQDTLAGNSVGICDELITLEISSPDVCDLTLIDLPGITRVPVNGQPEDIGDQIRSLILKHIDKSEAIILVVVPCNVDIATTEALRMAQNVDPEGLRTLAILTKPDLIDRGAEMDVLNIVEGKVIPLSKGYIIVRCRGQSDINNRLPFEKAMEAEQNFFRKHPYFSSLLAEGNASIQCLALKLTKELGDHIKKSLPTLTEQIQNKLLNVQRDLKNFDQGPPLSEELMGPFLSEIILMFSDQINELSRTGHSSDGNIYTVLRPVFKKWDSHLRSTEATFKERVTKMIEEYNEVHRGRELLTFSEFCEFECVIQNHVAALQEPAIETLNDIREIVQDKFREVCYSSFEQYPPLRYIISNMINDIQSKQEAEAEKRIKEFINMEQLVFTQDKVLQKKLDESELLEKTGLASSDTSNFDEDMTFNSKGCSLLDTRNMVPDKLVLYYEIVYQRLTDYVPMLITLFMLKDAAKTLRYQIIELRNGADVCKLLSEDPDRERIRADLKHRQDRLSQALDLISNRL